MTPLVYVMGPSGAGKDTVLRLARAALEPREKIAFAHRYITRPPDPRFENYVSLTRSEFETRRVNGLLAFDWKAYGFRYGVGVEIDTWRRAGFVVVVSGSRAHFATLRPSIPDLLPVLVTAPPEVLAQRLAMRRREDDAARAERLSRARSFAPSAVSLITIDNSGAPAVAGKRFLDLVRQAAREKTRQSSAPAVGGAQP